MDFRSFFYALIPTGDGLCSASREKKTCTNKDNSSKHGGGENAYKNHIGMYRVQTA